MIFTLVLLLDVVLGEMIGWLLWTVSGPLKREQSVASNNFVKTHVMNVSNSEKAALCVDKTFNRLEDTEENLVYVRNLYVDETLSEVESGTYFACSTYHHIVFTLIVTTDICNLFQMWRRVVPLLVLKMSLLMKFLLVQKP